MQGFGFRACLKECIRRFIWVEDVRCRDAVSESWDTGMSGFHSGPKCAHLTGRVC